MRNLDFVVASVVNTKHKDGDGQGVILSNGLILTAAHCIFAGDLMSLVLGDSLRVSLEKGEKRVLGEARVIEPFSDIAVLSHSDCHEADWESFISGPGVSIYGGSFNTEVRLNIWSHEGRWINARYQPMGFGQLNSGQIIVSADSPILGGTSGGPVVTDDGELFGLVSHGDDDADCDDMECFVAISLPALALPRWVLERSSQRST